MTDRVVKATPQWEYYIIARSDGTATGNVYLGNDLVYRCNLDIVPEDWGYTHPDDVPEDLLIERIQHHFAHTLWGVLYEAQSKKERGQ